MVYTLADAGLLREELKHILGNQKYRKTPLASFSRVQASEREPIHASTSTGHSIVFPFKLRFDNGVNYHICIKRFVTPARGKREEEPDYVGDADKDPANLQPRQASAETYTWSKGKQLLNARPLGSYSNPARGVYVFVNQHLRGPSLNDLLLKAIKADDPRQLRLLLQNATYNSARYVGLLNQGRSRSLGEHHREIINRGLERQIHRLARSITRSSYWMRHGTRDGYSQTRESAFLRQDANGGVDITSLISKALQAKLAFTGGIEEFRLCHRDYNPAHVIYPRGTSPEVLEIKVTSRAIDLEKQGLDSLCEDPSTIIVGGMAGIGFPEGQTLLHLATQYRGLERVFESTRLKKGTRRRYKNELLEAQNVEETRRVIRNQRLLSDAEVFTGMFNYLADCLQKALHLNATYIKYGEQDLRRIADLTGTDVDQVRASMANNASSTIQTISEIADTIPHTSNPEALVGYFRTMVRASDVAGIEIPRGVMARLTLKKKNSRAIRRPKSKAA